MDVIVALGVLSYFNEKEIYTNIFSGEPCPMENLYAMVDYERFKEAMKTHPFTKEELEYTAEYFNSTSHPLVSAVLSTLIEFYLKDNLC